MKEDFIIVGSGFFGSVIAERIANELKKNVLILEKRENIGGNCYSEYDAETNIEYHKYGTHIFHTSNESVWKYINNFTDFNSYKHQVLSKYKNKIYQLPFNLETINTAYKKNFTPEEAKFFLSKEINKLNIINPKNFEEKALKMVGKKLYEMFIKEYTLKQWGIDPKNLPSSIINRIPVRFNYNEDYFLNSRWQGVPSNGYTSVFKKLLDSKRIRIKFNYNFKLKDLNPKIPILYTGPLDSLFNYKFGRLDWRSIKFKHKIAKVDDYQGNSVVNYPENINKFTRIHEPKHLHPERDYIKNKTLLIYEFPITDLNNPYYPINTSNNRKLYRKYKELSKKYKNFFIGGRLADYAYYDMDMTISAALQLYKNKIKKILI